MKILWWSTAPWSPSSYSVLTGRVVPNLVRDKHNIMLGTWYGLQGCPLPWAINGPEGPIGEVTVLPAIDGGNYGQGVIDVVYREIKPDVLITCSDVWVFPASKTQGANFCPWFPIDHDPTPPPVMESLASAVYPMVYSSWGREVLARDGVKAEWVPCSAPGDVYTPGDKAIARQKLGMPQDAEFIAVMVAANKDPNDRKGFNEAILGFARFAETHPDAYLYVHTNWDGPVKIHQMTKTLGLEKRVIMPDQFRYNFGMLDKNYMVAVYQAADVLLNPAKSEGFGLPIVEAQMCGCPVAATDYGTTDELLFAGWKIPIEPDWTVGADSFRGRASIGGVAAALMAAYDDRHNEALPLEAREGIMFYDTQRVFDTFWRPALAEIEAIVNGGRQVYDFAKSVDIPTQPFGAKADRKVPKAVEVAP